MFDVALKYNNARLEQTAFPGKLSESVCHEVEATVTVLIYSNRRGPFTDCFITQ